MKLLRLNAVPSLWNSKLRSTQVVVAVMRNGLKNEFMGGGKAEG